MSDLSGLSDSQLERFQRHLSLSGFGPEPQQRLLDSRVLVIGAGGLGAPVLTYLAAAGVGRLEIVDDDVVDRSNLHRQVIHAEERIGEPKTASAAGVMRGLHPEVDVVEHRCRITPDNALDLVRDVDLVIDGSDNFLTRYVVSDAAEILGKPVVYGAILRFSGQVSVFWAGRGPTYRDLYPELPDPREVPTCAEAGVLGVLPGVVGTLMATEAIKVLTGIGEPLLGRILFFDALAASFRELALAPDPGRARVEEVGADLGPLLETASACAVGGGESGAAGSSAAAGGDGEAGGDAGNGAEAGTGVDAGTGTTTAGTDADAGAEISPARLRELLSGAPGGTAVRLLDVREGWEHRLGAIPDALHVPLGGIVESGGDLPALEPLGLGEDADVVVVYCKAGVRSRRAQDVLRERYPQARLLSLAGGYDAWSRG
ncbi:molybdopterin-synthase adenylyltransferase MoeB [Rothia sp. AR01]|uniref:Molybdopterin-synthase adenylyltransferase MoeB n=1 Tax=Rothia santali TaxID=2949643 RepID=A0A9X2KIN2_9MICC|nr:molybdopterin-synthase adenylyltransferase MoeB [Rothia santali]MCP3426205.1 molybdopterin-synthase adenylyltransferase MoeB [Rothia santali]